MMKNLLLILGLLFFASTVAQPPSRFYTKFGSNGDDIGYSVKTTLDKQYIIAGSTSSFGSTDVYLVKLDSMGLPIWSKNLGGVGIDVGKSVIQLPDSGFVVAGYTNSFGAGGYDAYLIRTDKNGNLLWQRTFGGTDWDFANDLVLTSNGNIALVGNTSSFGNGKKDGMILIYDYSGNILKQKFYGGAENEEFKSIIATIDGFLATAGYTESYSDTLGDHYFLKLDLNADTLFTKKFGNPGKSHLNDLVQFPNGNYILVGSETYTNLPFTQSYRTYINAQGTLVVWHGNSTTSSDEEGWKSVTKSIFGSARTSTLRDFYKNGFKKQGGIFSNAWDDFYPAIVNEFGGGEDERLYSHEGTKDGGFICVGSTRSFGSIGEDIFIIKLDSTIINYAQIVGIQNSVAKGRSNPIIYATESEIQLYFNTNRIPDNIEIISLDGRLIHKFSDVGEKFSVNVQNLMSSLYLFKFNYSDRNCFIVKIPIQ